MSSGRIDDRPPSNSPARASNRGTRLMSNLRKLAGVSLAKMRTLTVAVVGAMLLVASGTAVESRPETTAARAGGASGITRLQAPPTGTSLAAPARNTVFSCRGQADKEVLTRPASPWLDAQGVIDVTKRPVVEG